MCLSSQVVAAQEEQQMDLAVVEAAVINCSHLNYCQLVLPTL
jgi:hypothetical protein